MNGQQLFCQPSPPTCLPAVTCRSRYQATKNKFGSFKKEKKATSQKRHVKKREEGNEEIKFTSLHAKKSVCECPYPTLYFSFLILPQKRERSVYARNVLFRKLHKEELSAAAAAYFERGGRRIEIGVVGGKG